MFKLRQYLLDHLGPALITGAADDDPSGIATYSQAGAQFGYGMLWSVLLTTPLMVGIQVVSRAHRPRHRPRHSPPTCASTIRARCWCSSCRCCSSPTRSTSPPTSARWARRCSSSSAARRTATRCIFGVRRRAVAAVPAVSAAGAGAEVADAVAVRLCAGAVHRATSTGPLVAGDAAAAAQPLARLPDAAGRGARARRSARTCSSGRRRRKSRSSARPPATSRSDAPEQVQRHLRRIKIDTWIGMAFSNAIAFCIMLTTAATLHERGHHQYPVVGAGGTGAAADRRRSRRSCCSRSASSAPACWRFRCSRARPPMPWPNR